MYIHTLMCIKNGGSESFVNMKPKHPDSCMDGGISGVVGQMLRMLS